MSQSDEELSRSRERESLKRDILEELKSELLGKEIVFSPKSSDGKKDIGQHPALLLILGFIFTGLVGSWLTSYWKDKEWINQQSQLERQKVINQKYAVIEKVTKAVAEAYVGVEDIVHLAENGWYDRNSDEKTPKRVANWLKASHDWRVNSEVIRRDIEVNFKNAEAQSLFAKIANDWDILNNDTICYQIVLKKKDWKEITESDKCPDGYSVIKLEGESKDRLRLMSKRTGELMSLLLKEIQQDIKRSEIAGPRIE